MKFTTFLKSSLLFNSFYCLFLFINKILRLSNLKPRAAVNAKSAVFDIYVEAIIHLLLYNLHDCTFKDAIPKLLKSFVIYKFAWPGCNACYIGEITRHLSTRIEEHLEKDKKSHIFKDLNENHNCKTLSTPDCFQIIDFASSKFRLKLKEAMHITISLLLPFISFITLLSLLVYN